jgi:hypothetical protein
MARDLGDCSRCTRPVDDASDLTGAVHSNQSTEVDVTIFRNVVGTELSANMALHGRRIRRALLWVPVHFGTSLRIVNVQWAQAVCAIYKAP